jgi:transcriptional regulator with XRE-family HTH domain
MNDRERRLARRIGDAIRQNRRQLGWSQADLAEEAEVSVDHIGLLERGMRLPAVPLLVTLSELFAVPLDSLVSGEQPEELLQTVALLQNLPVGQLATVRKMLRGLIAGDTSRKPRKRLSHN